MKLGQHGVNIFFVLSGYLITTILLHSNSGKINLREFYTRRIFRLMPASLFYLSFIALISFFIPLKPTPLVMMSCLFIFKNYVNSTARDPFTPHYWSLSLEEQFYLVWPFLLSRFKRKISGYCALLAILFITVFRFVRWGAYIHRFGRAEVRGDAILIGCLLAIILFENEAVSKWFQRYGNVVLRGCAPLFIADIFYFHDLIPTHENVLIALMIGSTVHCPHMLASRILETKVFRTIGVMSYSIYLWHLIWLTANWGWTALVLCPASICFSWICIEKPGIAWGRQWIQRWNHARRLPTLMTPSGIPYPSPNVEAGSEP
jgi:peptidoglycan/LPS O-acetylase OafA/YrhL